MFWYTPVGNLLHVEDSHPEVMQSRWVCAGGVTVGVAFMSGSERGALHHCRMTLQLAGQHYQPLYLHRWSPKLVTWKTLLSPASVWGWQSHFQGVRRQLKQTGQTLSSHFCRFFQLKLCFTRMGGWRQAETSGTWSPAAQTVFSRSVRDHVSKTKWRAIPDVTSG